MDRKAIAKANARLHKMHQALERMKTGNSPSEIEGAWGDFIFAASTAYNSLLQGSKTNNKSKDWFNKRKNERRKDPLLLYVKEARNSEEHGIEDITKRTNSQIHLTSQGDQVTLRSDGRQWHVVSQKGNVRYPLDRVRLIPVKNGYGDTFDPPESHLGQPLADISPVGVAEATYAYIKAMIEDAQTLPD